MTPTPADEVLSRVVNNLYKAVANDEVPDHLFPKFAAYLFEHVENLAKVGLSPMYRRVGHHLCRELRTGSLPDLDQAQVIAEKIADEVMQPLYKAIEEPKSEWVTKELERLLMPIADG